MTTLPTAPPTTPSTSSAAYDFGPLRLRAGFRFVPFSAPRLAILDTVKVSRRELVAKGPAWMAHHDRDCFGSKAMICARDAYFVVHASHWVQAIRAKAQASLPLSPSSVMQSHANAHVDAITEALGRLERLGDCRGDVMNLVSNPGVIVDDLRHWTDSLRRLTKTLEGATPFPGSDTMAAGFSASLDGLMTRWTAIHGALQAIADATIRDAGWRKKQLQSLDRARRTDLETGLEQMMRRGWKVGINPTLDGAVEANEALDTFASHGELWVGRTTGDLLREHVTSVPELVRVVETYAGPAAPAG